MTVLQAAALAIYGLAMRLAQPLLRRKLARRSVQEPLYGQAIEERFGHYSQPCESTSDLVWLHAVSLGEARAAAVLLAALRAAHPGLRLLLTHGTATGRAEGAQLLKAGDVQVWQPWDSPGAVQRFFAHFKPRLGLLMETEVWPCALAEAARLKTPLLLVNARMSEKSLRRALRFALLGRPAYAGLAAVLAQTGPDAERLKRLGCGQVTVTGNLKFDATPDAKQLAQGRAWAQAIGQPVVMLASSRDGEEAEFFKQIVATAQSKTAATAINSGAQTRSNPPPKWLVVPRHPQRFDEVAKLARSCGLAVSRRSSWTCGPDQDAQALSADVWLGDSMGEMALYYAASSVALLGGSFEKFGGQNLIEAAACGCPVVMGPHTFNFAEAAEGALAAGAAQRAIGIAQALEIALAWLADSAKLSAARQAGLAFAEAHQGASQKTLSALRPYLRRYLPPS